MLITSAPVVAAAPGAPARMNSREASVEHIAYDTVELATREPYYQGAAKVMYAGLQNIRSVAVPTEADPARLQENLKDINTIAQAADRYAHSLEKWKDAAPVLYQALDDVALIAHGAGGAGSEKVEVAHAILDRAEARAHRQKDWSQAAVTMYQAIDDVRILAKHDDPAVSADETSLLATLDQLAESTSKSAHKVVTWEDAAKVLYSGLDSMQAVVHPQK